MKLLGGPTIGRPDPSPPSRGARIETTRFVLMRAEHVSPPSRGARIETSRFAAPLTSSTVAPFTGGAD